LCDAVPIAKAEELGNALVTLFEKNNLTLEVIQLFIRWEVENSEDFGTLFRANSMATKLIKCYGKIVGKKYLKKIFAPLIRKINDINFEVIFREMKILRNFTGGSSET
jgi:hypothetical protein